MKTKYTEILKLKEMLEKANIEFDWLDRSIVYPPELNVPKHEHYQIRVFNKDKTKQIISVIQGSCTYGEEENLLEIMGCLTKEESREDCVLGYLTAENVFNRIVREKK